MAGAVTYLQTAKITTGASTYTFSSQNFGTASSDRVIILKFSTRVAGNVALSASSVTIGGVSATIAVQLRATATNTNFILIAFASVPTGTSGDVVVTLSHSTLRASCSLDSATGIDPTVVDSATSTAANPTYAIDVPADGIAVAAAVSANVNSWTWSGLTERYDDDFTGSQPRFTGACDAFASTQTNLSVTATPSIPGEGSQVGAFVSFGPASATSSRLLNLRRRAVGQA